MNIKLLLVALVAALPLFAFAQATEFVPLTSLPGLDDFTSSSDLPAFLNNIYKICIGAAAALAVFQIMHAGFKFMTNKGSVSENEQAKHLLQMSIFGLLLVLSPVIVFGIINPQILSLEFNVDKLKITDPVALPAGAENTVAVYANTNTTAEREAAKAKCEALGGTAVFTCTPKEGGAGRTVKITEACAPNENSSTVCRKEGGAVSADPTCSTYSQAPPPQAVTGGFCNGSAGYEQAPASCCSNLQAGSVCCAQRKGAPPAQVTVAHVTQLVNSVLSICTVTASDSEKANLVTQIVVVANTYNMCVAASNTATAVAACESSASNSANAAAVTNIKNLSKDDADCIAMEISNQIDSFGS